MNLKKFKYIEPKRGGEICFVVCNFCGISNNNILKSLMDYDLGYSFCNTCKKYMEYCEKRYLTKEVPKSILNSTTKSGDVLQLPFKNKYCSGTHLKIFRSNGSISYGKLMELRVVKYDFGWSIGVGFLENGVFMEKKLSLEQLLELNSNILDENKMSKLRKLQQNAIHKLLE